MQKALVLLSGGIDSMACAHFLKNKFDIYGLFIDYGQSASSIESDHSRKVGNYLGIDVLYNKIELGVRFGSGEIPGRNGLLIFSALATGSEKSTIVIGTHAGTTYYDCTEMFINRMNIIVQEYSSGKVQVISPFIHWSKPQIYEYCLNEQLDLSITYSCEAGTVPPCGQCASCLDRKILDAGKKAHDHI